jgi:hypothetical protein
MGRQRGFCRITIPIRVTACSPSIGKRPSFLPLWHIVFKSVVETAKPLRLAASFVIANTLAEEINDGTTGYLIERALDEARAQQFNPVPGR